MASDLVAKGCGFYDSLESNQRYIRRNRILFSSSNALSGFSYIVSMRLVIVRKVLNEQ